MSLSSLQGLGDGVSLVGVAQLERIVEVRRGGGAVDRTVVDIVALKISVASFCRRTASLGRWLRLWSARSAASASGC